MAMVGVDDRSLHGFKRQLKTFLFQQSAWLTLHQRLCSLGFYGALEICILLLLLLQAQSRPAWSLKVKVKVNVYLYMALS